MFKNSLQGHTSCAKCELTLNGPLTVHGPYGGDLCHRPDCVREASQVGNEAVFSTNLINRGTDTEGRNKLDMLDPNQSASIIESLLHQSGGLQDCVSAVFRTVPRTRRLYGESHSLQITLIMFKQERIYEMQYKYTGDCQST
jgi:hypothetical protein